MKLFQIFITLYAGYVLGAIVTRLYDLRHIQDLQKLNTDIREKTKHGLIYRTPWTGKIIRVHTKANTPKSYLWRWPPKHPGGRPTGPQNDTDMQALELQKAGVGDDEIFTKLYAPSLTENIRQDPYTVRQEKATVIRRLKRLTNNSKK